MPVWPSTAHAIIWPSGDSEAWRILRVFSSSAITLPMRGSGVVAEAAALRTIMSAIRSATQAGANQSRTGLSRQAGGYADISRDASTPLLIHSQVVLYQELLLVGPLRMKLGFSPG